MIQNSGVFNIDLNAQDNMNRTPFHVACRSGEIESVELMIQKSAEFNIDLNAKTVDGNTALHFAR